jgi:hypothetical protein
MPGYAAPRLDKIRIGIIGLEDGAKLQYHVLVIGAYIHEIGENLFHRGHPNERWRLKQNIARNGNLYPTHGLGPVAQIMNVNHGNRMEYLVSSSTKDFMMNEIAKRLATSDDYFK